MRPLLLLAVAIAAAFSPAAAVAQQRDPGLNLVVVTGRQIDARAEELLGWLQNDEQLRTLKARANFQHFTTDNPLYRERYAAQLPPDQLPIIALANRDGRVFYKGSGSSIPSSPEALRKSMGLAYNQFRQFDRPATPADPVVSSDCPNCPLDPSPFNPDPLAGPLDWQPGGGLLDRAIPDTVEINPSIDASSLGPWIAGAIGVSVLALLGLIACAAGVAIFVAFVVFATRSP